MNKRFVSIVIVIMMLGIYLTLFYCHKGPSKEEQVLGSIESLAQKEYYIDARRGINLFLMAYSGNIHSIHLAKARKLKAEIDSLIKDEEQVRQKRFSEEVEGISKRYDEFADATYYEGKALYGYCTKGGRYTFVFCLHMGEKGDINILALEISLFARDWLFIENYIIKADANLFSITPEAFEVKRDILRREQRGQIRETYSKAPLIEDDIKIIEAIISSKEAKIRFSGSRGSADGIITEKQKTALKNMLNAYKIMRRKLLAIETFKLLTE